MSIRNVAGRLAAALFLALPAAAGAAFTNLTGIAAVSAGESHMCAIANGVAYCWGANASGQLGNNSTTDSATPVAVIGLPSPVTAIAAGQNHSCAVAGPTNDVYCWGLNDNFQLGPTVSPNFCGPAANIPCAATAQKSSPSNTAGATAVAAGWYHTCAIVGGSVKCWGLQGTGRLGDGINAFTAKAASAATVVTNTAGATVVSGGSNWSCALVGTVVRCWGGNGSGSLGDGTGNDSATAVTVSGISTAVGLAGGDSHACAVLSSGAVQCWGANSFGQLGNNSVSQAFAPVAVSTIASGVGSAAGQVAAGASHTCAVVSGGLKCWGRNDYQQADAVATTPLLVPPAVARIASGVSSVTVGGYHTCAVLSGTLQCVGRNVNGQLGTGFNAVASSALAATPLTDGAARIASGSLHACAVRGGQVVCWGYNGWGQLGNGSLLNSPSPVAVSGIASGATAVAMGANHSCAIVNGGVKCWGLNQNGQLGNNSTTTSLAPVDVILTPPSTLLANVTAIAAGTAHTCAVVTVAGFSNVYCWGANNTGQLGDNTTTQRLVATQTIGSSTGGATAVAAGNNHTCAIVANDALKCWGNNSAGQLGTNVAGNTLQAAFAGSLFSGVTALATGSGHTCAVQNGVLKCYGANSNGQLGDGTSVTPSPLGNGRIPINSGVTGVAAGFGHTCAIVNGGLKCWGDGTKGQLGNGSLASSLVPSDVPGLAGVAAVSAGSSHTCALLGGGVTCFGYGEFGELGSPRYAFASAPVTVKTGFTSGTSLLSDRNPSTLGQSVTLSAGIALNVSNPSPGGTVAFKDGGTAIAGCGAVPLTGTGTMRRATCTTTALAGGTRSLTAEYTGDANYAPSSSPALSQLVQVTTPTAFGFVHQTSVAPGSVVTSNTITISGITITVPISITGGQYSLGCTGTFTTAPATVSAGATVCVRLVTPVALGATATATLTVGTGSAPFNATTALASPGTNPPTIATGISHNLVVTPTGQVWGWGDNTAGKLGNGNTTVSTVPVRAQGLTNVIAVAAGMGHSLALKADGTVWAWGLDDQGQLGNGSTSPDTCAIEGQFGTFACSLLPRQVTGLANVVAISAGWRHSMALRSDGSVWTWGSDFYGQRGDGSTGGDVPGPVTLAGVFTRVAAGYMHSLALRSDGSVWAWGRGVEGALGPATTSSTPTPTQVTGFASAVNEIAAGGGFNLARLANNSLVAWGSNRYGTLGDFTVPVNNGAGVASFRAAPAPVNNAINVAEFSAGFGWAILRRTDGTVWAWGLNNRQQTGLASTSTNCGQQGNRPCVRDPLNVQTKAGAIRVLAGGAHALTVRPDNTLDLFGDNGVGQLGNISGNFGQPIAPPPIFARFDQSVYDPDVSLTPGGAFGTPAGVGRAGTGGALDLDSISAGVEFGASGVGTPAAPVTVVINNVSDPETIDISSITAVGDTVGSEFTLLANLCPASLTKGASCSISLGFTPAGFGPRSGTLTINTNAAQSPTITLALTGTGVDTRVASTVTLGTTASTVPAGVTVTYTATVSAGGASVAGNATFLDNGTPIAGCSAVPVVGTNAVCTTSALSIGVHPITADYSGNPSVQPSSSAVLYQTVIAVPSSAGALTAVPSSLDFGGQSMNTTSPALAMTLTNTGGSALTVSSIAASTYFAVTHNCGALAAGASCAASITFTPGAEGALFGTLTVTTSAGAQGFSLAGTGERSLVTHYYRAILRRAPDAGGKAFWESEKVRLQGLGANFNETRYAMATFFFFSPEYASFNRDDTGFVTDLYNTFFNRAPDGGGLAFWTGASQGMPREVVLVSFMFSPEVPVHAGDLRQRAARKEVDTVVDFYRGLLSRLPDDGASRAGWGSSESPNAKGRGRCTRRWSRSPAALPTAGSTRRGTARTRSTWGTCTTRSSGAAGTWGGCSSGSTSWPRAAARATRCARTSSRARSSPTASTPSSPRGACPRKPGARPGFEGELHPHSCGLSHSAPSTKSRSRNGSGHGITRAEGLDWFPCPVDSRHALTGRGLPAGNEAPKEPQCVPAPATNASNPPPSAPRSTWRCWSAPPRSCSSWRSGWRRNREASPVF